MQIKRIALGGIIMTVIMFTPTYTCEVKCGPSAFAAATGISVCDADREESIRGSV